MSVKKFIEEITTIADKQFVAKTTRIEDTIDILAKVMADPNFIGEIKDYVVNEEARGKCATCSIKDTCVLREVANKSAELLINAPKTESEYVEMIALVNVAMENMLNNTMAYRILSGQMFAKPGEA